MNPRNIGAVALLAPAMLAVSGAPHALAALPQGDPGAYTLDDDGSKILAANITSAKTYRVHNNGPDDSINVIVRDEDNVIIDEIELQANNSLDIGVPADGDLLVKDPTDSDSDGAAGTYEVI